MLHEYRMDEQHMIDEKQINTQHQEWVSLASQHAPSIRTNTIWIYIFVGVFTFGSFYSSTSITTTTEQLMLIGPTVWSEPWRLLTYMLLHGSWLHLIMNTLAFYQLAMFTETLYGSWRFQLIFVISGIFGGITSVWWNPMVNTVGASGAILGLMGAILAYTMVLKHHLPTDLKKQMIRDVWITCALTGLLGFLIPNIDNAAHIGGFISGLILGFALAPRAYPTSLGIRLTLATTLLVTCAFIGLTPNRTILKTYESDRRFDMVLKDVWSKEEVINAKYKSLIAEADTLKFQEWEIKYNTEIMEPLNELAASLDNIKLTATSSKKIEYTVLVRYMALKKQEAETVKTWIKTRDLKMLDLINTYNDEYAALTKTLKGVK